MNYTAAQFEDLKENLHPLLSKNIRSKVQRNENNEIALSLIKKSLASGLKWEDAFELKNKADVKERLWDVLLKWNVDVVILEKLSPPLLDMKTPYQQKSTPGQTWFHGAIQQNNVDLFKYLLKNQFQGDWSNEKGRNPAFYVESKKTYELFKKEFPVALEEIDNNGHYPAHYWASGPEKISLFVLDFEKNNPDLLPVQTVCKALAKTLSAQNSDRWKVAYKYKKLVRKFESDYLNTPIKLGKKVLPAFDHNILDYYCSDLNHVTMKYNMEGKEAIFPLLDMSLKKEWDPHAKAVFEFYHYNQMISNLDASNKKGMDDQEESKITPTQRFINQLQISLNLHNAIKEMDLSHSYSKTDYGLAKVMAKQLFVAVGGLCEDRSLPNEWNRISSYLPGFDSNEVLSDLNLFEESKGIFDKFIRVAVTQGIIREYVQLDTNPLATLYPKKVFNNDKFSFWKISFDMLFLIIEEMKGYVPEEKKFRSPKENGSFSYANQNEFIIHTVFTLLDEKILAGVLESGFLNDKKFNRNFKELKEIELRINFGSDYKGEFYEQDKQAFEKDTDKYFKLHHIGVVKTQEKFRMIEDFIFKTELDTGLIKADPNLKVKKIESRF